jgi:hypothetical protein
MSRVNFTNNDKHAHDESLKYTSRLVPPLPIADEILCAFSDRHPTVRRAFGIRRMASLACGRLERRWTVDRDRIFCDGVGDGDVCFAVCHPQ